MCIKRTEMPQIKLDDYGLFTQYCIDQGITVRRGFIHPAMVRSVQCFGPWRKHRVTRETLQKPLIVSGDHIILDGNTRWGTAMDLGIDVVNAYTLHLTFPEAMKALIKFPQSYLLTADVKDQA